MNIWLRYIALLLLGGLLAAALICIQAYSNLFVMQYFGDILSIQIVAFIVKYLASSFSALAVSLIAMLFLERFCGFFSAAFFSASILISTFYLNVKGGYGFSASSVMSYFSIVFALLIVSLIDKWKKPGRASQLTRADKPSDPE